MSDSATPATGSIYRQGDVLLRRIDEVPYPITTTVVPREEGRIVLAHGEMTGHAHAIDAPLDEATLLTAADQRRFLRLARDVELRHEEHATINLPAGLYQVIRQREWTDARRGRGAVALRR